MGALGNSPKKKRNAEKHIKINERELDKNIEGEKFATDTIMDAREIRDDGLEDDLVSIDDVDFKKLVSETKLQLEAASRYLKKYTDFSLGETGCPNENLTDIVNSHGKLNSFLEGETIIRAGEESSGLFVIVKGTVDVLTTDESLTIRQLSDGDVFGEISTVFGLPCTATIKAKTEVITVIVEPDAAFELFESHAENLDLIDWFIKHRYLPFGEGIEIARTYRRMALHFLRRIPSLEKWSIDLLKNLVLSFDRSVVTLYPPKSTLISLDDPISSLLIVTSGNIEVEGEKGFKQTVNVSPNSKPFIYGHLFITTDDPLSSVTIRATTNCQVIVVENEWLLSVSDGMTDAFVKTRTKMFSSFKQKLVGYYKEFRSYLEFDFLYNYLDTSGMYDDKSRGILEYKILNAVYEDFDEGATVFLGVERGRYEAILVVNGEVIVKQHAQDKREHESASRENITLPGGTKRVSFRKARDNGASSITEEHAKTLPDGTEALWAVYHQGSVIDLAVLDSNLFTLRSRGKSLVCKIPKGEHKIEAEREVRFADAGVNVDTNKESLERNTLEFV